MDGVEYHLASREPVFTKTVVFDDGSSETFSRRERPFVSVNEQSAVVALLTVCLSGRGPARIVVQTVDRYIPKN